jgi:prepilin-type N-terminal cleavage/methylation domain-containing protein
VTGERAPRSSERGMTLIELLIAVLILSVVIAAAFSVSYAIMNSYREHRRSINVERSVRGAMAVLTEAVRNSSPGVPDGDIVDLVGCDFFFKGLRVENASDGPDALDVIYATGASTTLRAEFNEGSTQILVEDGSLLRAGDQVLITDFDRGHLIAITTVVNAPPDWIVTLAGSPQTVCSPGPPTFNAYPVRSTVIRAQRARFTVDTTSMPLLFMDRDGPAAGSEPPQPVAEGIEDLQISIGIDRNANGGLDELGATGDDDDWVYNNPDDSQPLPNIALTPFRAVRLTVIARSVDDTTNVTSSRLPAAEDRPQAAADDVFRRRSLSATIELRNIQGSP